MIKVAIVDDHPVVRQGLRALFEREKNLTVIGEAQDGRRALQIVRSLKPDVVTLDISMPDVSGLDLIPEMKRLHAPVRVLVLSMHDQECYLVRALRQGADGFVLKEATGEELVQGICAVNAGRRYLSRQLAESVLDSLLDFGDGTGASARRELTEREEEVLRFTVEGMSSTQIAQRMGISSRTVETHRSNLMHKLGVHSRAELVRHTLERRMLPRESAIPAQRLLRS
jgi:two-component system nitrate/nitrite response regulator NarL